MARIGEHYDIVPDIAKLVDRDDVTGPIFSIWIGMPRFTCFDSRRGISSLKNKVEAGRVITQMLKTGENLAKSTLRRTIRVLYGFAGDAVAY